MTWREVLVQISSLDCTARARAHLCSRSRSAKDDTARHETTRYDMALLDTASEWVVGNTERSRERMRKQTHAPLVPFTAQASQVCAQKIQAGERCRIES